MIRAWLGIGVWSLGLLDKMKPNSFTIIELLVVIAIIAIIAVIVFPNYKSGQREFALERAAHKLVQDIRRVQQMAMSAVECEKCTGDDEGKVPAGYGIVLKKQEAENRFYVLYADDGNQVYDPGTDQTIETIYFEEGVEIKNVNPADLSINFKPPDPEVTIKGLGTGQNYTSIIVTLSDEPKTKTITVNEAGLITVSD